MVKYLPANAGDARYVGSIPGMGRSHRVGNGSQLQYSCQENSMDRGAWQATVHRVAELNMTEQLSTYMHYYYTRYFEGIYFVPGILCTMP